MRAFLLLVAVLCCCLAQEVLVAPPPPPPHELEEAEPSANEVVPENEATVEAEATEEVATTEEASTEPATEEETTEEPEASHEPTHDPAVYAAAHKQALQMSQNHFSEDFDKKQPTPANEAEAIKADDKLILQFRKRLIKDEGIIHKDEVEMQRQRQLIRTQQREWRSFMEGIHPHKHERTLSPKATGPWALGDQGKLMETMQVPEDELRFANRGDPPNKDPNVRNMLDMVNTIFIDEPAFKADKPTQPPPF